MTNISDYDTICQGIADALAPLNDNTLNGGIGRWVKIRPEITDKPEPPVIQIFPGEIMYDTAGSRGGDTPTITIQALIAANFDKQAQGRLRKLMRGSGPLSIKELVEAENDDGEVLNGAAGVDDLRVVRCTGYQVYRPDGTPTIGANWEVQVETSDELE